MSKWTMTKFTRFSIAFLASIVIVLSINHISINSQSELITAWVSWLTNDNKSAHMHFLDLVELLHYSFGK